MDGVLGTSFSLVRRGPTPVRRFPWLLTGEVEGAWTLVLGRSGGRLTAGVSDDASAATVFWDLSVRHGVEYLRGQRSLSDEFRAGRLRVVGPKAMRWQLSSFFQDVARLDLERFWNSEPDFQWYVNRDRTSESNGRLK